jgi:predicted nucleic acid-binding protein
VRGSIGVVLLAKQQGLIEEAMPAVERLCQAGLYVTGAVLHTARELAGE